MKKLIWKGKQKDLAALIIELQEKNWIEKIEKNTLKAGAFYWLWNEPTRM